MLRDELVHLIVRSDLVLLQAMQGLISYEAAFAVCREAIDAMEQEYAKTKDAYLMEKLSNMKDVHLIIQQVAAGKTIQ